jgi:ABC-type Fe3+/spermidine/putrescine transport system ATPase subunit
MAAQVLNGQRVDSNDLSLVGVDKTFGNNRVLRELTLTVKRGELCCLLGPSGCGKTTALKIINGLLDPDHGSIYLGEEDITSLPPGRRNIGMLFQSYALFPTMNVYENVAYGLRRRKYKETEVATMVGDALNLVRLSGYSGRRTHELSGGEQQRVALARALVIEPRLLLLDEPLSNLDARLRADLRDELRHLQKVLNVTTVYVTHDQEEAMGLADRIVVMNRGVVEQVGTPREIYERPDSPFVADFIGRVNFLRGETADGKLRLLGEVYSLPEGTARMDRHVTCVVRPERIEFDAVDELSGQARIESVGYFGSTIRYRIMATGSDGRMETVQADCLAPSVLHNVGDNVKLRVNPHHIRIFPVRPEQ